MKTQRIALSHQSSRKPENAWNARPSERHNEDQLMTLLTADAIGQRATFLIIVLSCLLVLGITKTLSKAHQKSNQDSQLFMYGTIATSFIIIMSAVLIWGSKDLPAWLQGIGSIYAIIVAILVSRHEGRNAQERSRRERAEDHRREAQRVNEEKIETTRAIYQIVLRAFMSFSYVRENAYDKSLSAKDIGPRKGEPDLKITGGKQWRSLGFKAADIRVQLRQLEAFVEQLEKISPFEHRDAVLALLTSEFCASIKVLLADLKTGWNIESQRTAPGSGAKSTIKYPPCVKNATYTETEKLIGVTEYLAHGIFHMYLDEPECNRIEEVFLSWSQRANKIFLSHGPQASSGALEDVNQAQQS